MPRNYGNVYFQARVLPLLSFKLWQRNSLICMAVRYYTCPFYCYLMFVPRAYHITPIAVVKKITKY